MKKKSEGKTRKCLTLLGGRTSLLLCLSLMFQSSYAAEDSTVPEMGNMEIHQIAQQSSTIKGVVKDQKGEPLIGVSIEMCIRDRDLTSCNLFYFHCFYVF